MFCGCRFAAVSHVKEKAVTTQMAILQNGYVIGRGILLSRPRKGAVLTAIMDGLEWADSK